MSARKLDYYEQIIHAERKARKIGDFEQAYYYSQQFVNSACASWENFKGSWVYENWKSKFQNQIEHYRKIHFRPW